MAKLKKFENKTICCYWRIQLKWSLSKLSVTSWYEAVGEPTVADAILDRIVHTAHQIELTGESVRKIKGNRK